MAGEIIRMGDKTSHGGTVLEGSQTDICMGKPIAFVGHKTLCPKCRGTFPIVEGVLTTTFYGKGVAIAGMKTACGAILIASQFTDTVEWGSGSSNTKMASPSANISTVDRAEDSDAENRHVSNDPGDDNTDVEIQSERYYSVRDSDGNPVDGYRYDLHIDDQLHTKAGAYLDGATIVVDGNRHVRLVTWIENDSVSRT